MESTELYIPRCEGYCHHCLEAVLYVEREGGGGEIWMDGWIIIAIDFLFIDCRCVFQITINSITLQIHKIPRTMDQSI